MTVLDRKTLEEIDRHHWYQTIPLGAGYSTPGETGDVGFSKLELMDLPPDLSGKTVLDIGCNEGFFAFEAEKRHAARVVAVDKSSAAEEKFHLVKRILASNVEFVSANLFDLKASKFGSFDVVFFLSVLHHLRYPILAVDRLFELTRDFAVVEVVEAVPEIPGVSALVRKMSKKGHLHMLPTRAFLLEMLERAGFSRVEVLGAHRDHKMGEERKMPGFSEQRVLLKAFR